MLSLRATFIIWRAETTGPRTSTVSRRSFILKTESTANIRKLLKLFVSATTGKDIVHSHVRSKTKNFSCSTCTRKHNTFEIYLQLENLSLSQFYQITTGECPYEIRRSPVVMHKRSSFVYIRIEIKMVRINAVAIFVIKGAHFSKIQIKLSKGWNKLQELWNKIIVLYCYFKKILKKNCQLKKYLSVVEIWNICQCNSRQLNAKSRKIFFASCEVQCPASVMSGH